tara:strand:+ start:8371 stop:9153 length:783 start_codon:yes stop_codon:yes gene_type:complete
MRDIELKIIDVLKELKEKYAVIGIKAEFEAEGTRTEELIRLKEFCLRADLALTLKIGGCEAVRDMFDARVVGVDHLVAPMVETPYALKKYNKAIEIAFPEDLHDDVEFLINTETIDTVNNIDDILDYGEKTNLDGIVIGRSDLSGSLGISTKNINGDEIFNITSKLLLKAKQRNMTCVVGGNITADTIPFLKELPDDSLDRFETRKVCFQNKEALESNPAKGINRALCFELLWLEFKHKYYSIISNEDNKRIQDLRSRIS